MAPVFEPRPFTHAERPLPHRGSGRPPPDTTACEANRLVCEDGAWQARGGEEAPIGCSSATVPRQPLCPDHPPADGDACDSSATEPDSFCALAQFGCGAFVPFVCTPGGWLGGERPCGPCPDSPPPSGSFCTDYGASCVYPDASACSLVSTCEDGYRKAAPVEWSGVEWRGGEGSAGPPATRARWRAPTGVTPATRRPASPPASTRWTRCVPKTTAARNTPGSASHPCVGARCGKTGERAVRVVPGRAAPPTLGSGGAASAGADPESETTPTPGSGSGGSASAGVDCASLDTPTACAAQLDCRWLAPGCGEDSLPKAGCFPEVACSDDNDAHLSRPAPTSSTTRATARAARPAGWSHASACELDLVPPTRSAPPLFTPFSLHHVPLTRTGSAP
jgi:hypothetical protein